MKILLKAFQIYCKAIADPYDYIANRIMLMALGVCGAVAAFLLGCLLLAGTIASHGLILIPIIVVYYLFKTMVMYGNFLRDTEDD